MSKQINKQKINDFVNIYCELLGLDKNKDRLYFDYIKESIYRRALKYKDIKIPVSIDDYQNYIIKPKSNEWDIEDFLLNRLFLSMRQMNVHGRDTTKEGITADYIGAYGELTYNYNLVCESYKSFYKTEREITRAAFKTFTHEIGHALKSQYKGGYKYNSPHNDTIKNSLYLELINRLKNSKYKDEIIDSITDEDEELLLEKTGVKGRKNGYISNKKMYVMSVIDEMFNEDEAIELTGEITTERYTRIYDQDKNKKSGYYLNVPNPSSSYCKYYGIGIQLKYLLGNKNYFNIQYGNSDSVIETFDRYYQDISNSMFGEKKFTPFQVIYLNNISISKEHRSYESFIETNAFLARCYEKKLKSYLSHKTYDIESLNKILKELDDMIKYTTHHVNPEIDERLSHIVIYKSLKTYVSKLKSNIELNSMLNDREIEETKKENKQNS